MLLYEDVLKFVHTESHRDEYEDEPLAEFNNTVNKYKVGSKYCRNISYCNKYILLLCLLLEEELTEMFLL